MNIMRRITPLAVAATAAAGLAVTGSAAAAVPGDSRPAPRHPNAAASAAGITPDGGGYAGWSQAKHSSRMSPDRMRTGPVRRPGPITTGPSAPLQQRSGVTGMDVSAYQGNVDWSHYRSQGYRFAYVKATEGTYYQSDTFTAQFNGAKKAGMLRGAYHFANPSWTGGKAQANYFVKHGGAWKADGSTLPGMLDMEASPYGAACYGLTKKQMVKWVTAFTKRYRTLTGRDAVIYTSDNWWKKCTGNSTKFNQTNPLWIARWASTPGTLPGGWPYYTFWQYAADTIDHDLFNGTYARLKVLATG